MPHSEDFGRSHPSKVRRDQWQHLVSFFLLGLRFKLYMLTVVLDQQSSLQSYHDIAICIRCKVILGTRKMYLTIVREVSGLEFLCF